MSLSCFLLLFHFCLILHFVFHLFVFAWRLFVSNSKFKQEFWSRGPGPVAVRPVKMLTSSLPFTL